MEVYELIQHSILFFLKTCLHALIVRFVGEILSNKTWRVNSKTYILFNRNEIQGQVEELLGEASFCENRYDKTKCVDSCSDKTSDLGTVLD